MCKTQKKKFKKKINFRKLKYFHNEKYFIKLNMLDKEERYPQQNQQV